MFHHVMLIVFYVSIGGLVVAPLLALAGDLVKHLRARWRKRQMVDLYYERYLADQTIRALKRRGIHDLLAAEREYRDIGGSGDVIESTAVELES